MKHEEKGEKNVKNKYYIFFYKVTNLKSQWLLHFIL